MKISRILNEAAEVLQERGWTRKEYEDKEGHVCALGAIRIAAGTNNVHASNRESSETSEFLARFLMTSKLVRNPTYYSLIAIYNDKIAKNKREIIRLFKRAAKSAVKQGR